MKSQFETVSVLLQWKEHNPLFYSLMLGRIELAQVDKISPTSTHWFYTLKYTVDGEKSAFDNESKEEAMQICIDHAYKVIRKF